MEFFKKYLHSILLLFIITLVLIDIIIRLTFYTSLTAELFNNIATPVISLFGFLAVIFTLTEMKKSNDEKVSHDYLNFYNEKIQTAKLDLSYYTKDFQIVKNRYTNKNFYKLVYRIIDKIKTNKDYIADFITKTSVIPKENNSKYFAGRRYSNLSDDLESVCEAIDEFFMDCSFLLCDITSNKKLTTYHQEFLIMNLYKTILVNYIDFYWYKPKGKNIEIYHTGKEKVIKIYDVFFSEPFKNIFNDKKFSELYEKKVTL